MIFESFFTDANRLIEDYIKGKGVYWYNYINFIIYVILFVGSMIHNEIFIINRCGFNTKTKLYLNKAFNEENTNIDNLNILGDYSDKNEGKDKLVPLQDVYDDE